MFHATVKHWERLKLFLSLDHAEKIQMSILSLYSLGQMKNVVLQHWK